METIEISVLDLAFSALLILITGVISIFLKLNLEKRLFLASIRMVVQLFLVGFVLRIVFRIDNPFPLLMVLFVMITIASHTAVNRSSRFINGSYWIAFITLVSTGLLTTFSVTSLIINVDPWFQPRYVIPLLGMVIGNTMTGISLCLNSLLERFVEKQAEIECELALGATSWEAAKNPIKNSVKVGLIPMLNSMMVVGVVSLPGMMTGQILAGADPVQAVKYQIIILFMISASTALGCIMTALIVFKKVFNDKHQLRIERIMER